MNVNNGLIFAYILDAKGGGSAVDWKGINAWVPDMGTLWIHFDYTNEEVKKWLRSESNLSSLACEILIEEDTRPRILSSKDSLLLILRCVNCNPGADPDDMVALRMNFSENRIITMRHRRVMAINDVHEEIESGNGPTSASNLLMMVIDRIMNRMGDVINEIDDLEAELEDRVLSAESHELRSSLSQLRRQNIRFRRFIAPQHDILSRLPNETLTWISDKEKLHFREIAERGARFVGIIDAVHDRAAVTQEELDNRLAEHTNKAIYVLSIVAAIFLPLSFITGLLGINVGGIPGSEYKWAFLIVCFISLLIALMLLLIFKRLKWL
jgi:zinc transporter